MKAYKLISAGVSFVLSGAPVQAQSSIDVRCIIISNYFTHAAKDDKAKQLSQTTSAFFLGHVDHYNAAQLKAVADREKKALNGVQLGPIMNDCLKRLQGSGKLINEALQATPPAGAK